MDHNFVRCGINLSGVHKWHAFFEYICPRCKENGSYVVNPSDDKTPVGDFFRQFGNSIDEFYERQQSRIADNTIKDLLDDIET